MKIAALINNIEYLKVLGEKTGTYVNIQTDSRKIQQNDVFVAIPGTVTDGHAFIDKAIELGASCIVCEKLPDNILENVVYIQVKDSQIALGRMLSVHYGNPSSKLKIIGVIGTNGKTTTVTVLYNLFISLGYKTGLLSTVVNYINKKELEASHTTPDPVQLFSLLNEMVEAGCEYCFMEVSSHAIHQKRVEGIEFAGGVFTNITHDHLDYHKTFDEYLRVKKMFFDTLSPESFALVNNDDKNGEVMLQNTSASKYTYSLKSFSDFKCKILESGFSGMKLVIDGVEVWTRLIGQFNAYNLLGIYGAAILLGQDKNDVLVKLSSMEAVNGRFQVMTSKSGVNAIVDYAHTPDALVNVLNTINNIREQGQKIITVVGAGGDRDKTKRPVMGKYAAMKSDKVIITSDNPRSEDPSVIAEEMRRGVEIPDLKKVLTIIDRKEAIRTALHLAVKDDIVLVAGKGHENYQIINGVKSHFDDKEVIIEVFNEI